MDDARRLKVAYISESYGPHDHRFLAAIDAIASEAWHVQTDPTVPPKDPRATPVGTGRTRRLGEVEFPARVAELRCVLDEIAPDVIHAGPLQRVTFPTLLATDRPVVAASWGSDLMRAAKEDVLWRDVAALALDRAAGFLGDCQAVADAAAELGFRGPSANIPWGVDVGRFRPDGPRRDFGDAGDLVVLSTRNWEEIYDVQTVARAFAALPPTTPMHLVLCGSGSMEPLLREILADASAEGRVTWLGRVDQSELPTVYRSADVYVSTSKSDGSSVSLLEAMSSGTLPLVSDIPGNREWVVDDALRFPVGDSDRLRELLAQLRADGLPELGPQLRERVTRGADWSRAPERLAKLYAQVAR